MFKSSSEILREYAQIITEASIEDATGFSHGIDLPDESMMDSDDDEKSSEDNDFLTYDQVPETDPVINLSRALSVDSDKIENWLRKNNYEITPIGGLSNTKGNV
jgi:hypothetical protein